MLNGVSQVCLADISLQTESNACYVLGWNTKDQVSKESTGVMQEWKVSLLNENDCETLVGAHYDNRTMLCVTAKFNEEINLCEKDSGGPLVCTIKGQPDVFVLKGVALFNRHCARNLTWEVYALLGYYNQWIVKYSDEPNEDQTLKPINVRSSSTTEMSSANGSIENSNFTRKDSYISIRKSAKIQKNELWLIITMAIAATLLIIVLFFKSILSCLLADNRDTGIIRTYQQSKYLHYLNNVHQLGIERMIWVKSA